MNIKKYLITGIAAAGVLALAACAAPGSTEGSSDDAKPYDGQKLVVTTFGGDWEKAFIEAVVDPFEEETGADVEMVTLYSADALAQLTAQKSSPQLDVVHFSGGQEYVAASEGLIEPIAAEDLTNFADLAPVATAGLEHGEGPAIQLAPIGLVFNTESGADRPDSWLDVFDPQYAGHLALTDFSNTYGLLAMLRIADAQGNGVDQADPTIEQLGGLVSSGDAIVVPTSPDLQSAFAQRGTWLAPYSMDYAGTLKDAGLPVEFITPKEGAGASLITANVVSGREQTELAKLFVDFELSQNAQQVFAEKMRYSPVNTKAEVQGDAAKDVLTGDQLNTLVTYAPSELAPKRQGWVDTWNTVITN